MIVNDKIGITLSGGGFRGIAHLGVLQYLYELGIRPDAVSGTSAGAIVGAFIAEGYEPKEIFDFAKAEKFFRYSYIFRSTSGLFKTKEYERVIKKYIPHDSFDKLKIPLYISVTDLTNAQNLIFNQGPLSLAVQASASVPLVFSPVKYKNAYLCDGGIMNNFPVEAISATCNKVIGVNVNPIEKYEGNLSFRSILWRVIRIATSNYTREHISQCDVYIQPEELNKINAFSSKHMDESYAIGYDCAKKFEKELKALKEQVS